jgi:hypothetical protein
LDIDKKNNDSDRLKNARRTAATVEHAARVDSSGAIVQEPAGRVRSAARRHR